MCTEGLDNSALRWVKESSVNQTKEVPYSMLNLQLDRVPTNNAAAQRYCCSAQRQHPIYASGSVYADDVTSSREK
ncbi:hypothetical protein RHMOL_Rhmol12G0124000 [Rhododendron molle]|uniref:Uncharacterized protein n=1 Tax=Rhododendron molle TaxID=49168 RepID=A0ACC0LIE4_RHOML|nr:hypothetical protein RHMOL_Rhmol12G0124000 [Rhododendron molle]